MCIAPLAVHGSSVWQHPRLHGRKNVHDIQVHVLTAIQRRAGHIVTSTSQRVSCGTGPPVSRQAQPCDDPRFYEALEVYTDNRSALRSLRRPSQTSGQYLVREIVTLLEERAEGWDSVLLDPRRIWESSKMNLPTTRPNGVFVQIQEEAAVEEQPALELELGGVAAARDWSVRL
ncbi:uncharacterized protein ATNIH1004_000567 [Aspergillus tanneri]|uniref:Uncharacterized protein n=1 Tax=Aspergillus tanneri TaxID=1220188 RepID=A0A5M9MX34_9EURO|nr:uncharacterized protein ATNIH1004_000567 [Aspergillus tanneri]KAA8651671.1 hypothetical protein ATNIH1004_000567 [Aspergillus tanneri]